MYFWYKAIIRQFDYRSVADAISAFYEIMIESIQTRPLMHVKIEVLKQWAQIAFILPLKPICHSLGKKRRLPFPCFTRNYWFFLSWVEL